MSAGAPSEEFQYSVRAADWTLDGHLLKAVRFAVFVEEQGFAAEIELDGRDPDCLHVLAETDGEAIGTARLLPDGHLGRVAVLPPFRGRGIGRALMQAMLDAGRDSGLNRVELHAQVPAIPFYERLGFRVSGPEFDEAGAPHRLMVLDLEA